jgi:hypothetical protein
MMGVGVGCGGVGVEGSSAIATVDWFIVGMWWLHNGSTFAVGMQCACLWFVCVHDWMCPVYLWHACPTLGCVIVFSVRAGKLHICI